MPSPRSVAVSSSELPFAAICTNGSLAYQAAVACSFRHRQSQQRSFAVTAIVAPKLLTGGHIFKVIYTDSEIQILDAQGIFLNKLAARLYDIAHQFGK